MRSSIRSVVGRVARALAVAGVALGAIATGAMAQTSTAALRGHVLGTAREPVPDARIELTAPATGYRRSATTNQAGFYNIGAIPPGTYAVRVMRIGFQPTEREIRLQIGETITLDFAINEAAAQLTPITVTGAATTDVRSTEVATNVTTAQIENLPQGNRNFLDFATLAPGVRQQEAGISAGGTSVSNSNLFIDGASYKSDVLPGGVAGQDPSLARQIPGVGRVLGNPFPQNAVQEFRVISQNYKAEYQKASGAIVTAATKSGTNELHGDIFYSGQNDSWIARNWFQHRNAADVPNFLRSQFGASLGGPIVQDRTHFFASYEGNRQTSDVRVDFNPASGLPALPDSLLEGEGLYRTPMRAHLFFGKLTHRLNDRQDLMLSVNVRDEADDRDFGGSNAEDLRMQVQNDVTNAQLRHTLTGNALTNEAQISFQRFNWRQAPARFGDARFIFEEWGVTRGSNQSYQDFVQDRLSLRNDVTWALRNHVVKAGASLDFLKYDVSKRLEETPSFFFRPDRPGGFTSPYKAELQIGDPDLVTDNQQFGLYIQDDWSATQRLTLSLGVRWDVETNNLNNDFVTPAWVRTAVTTFAGEFPYFDPDDYLTDGDDREAFLGAIQPRLGFSFDVAGDGRTVIFGGGGLFYDRTNYNTLLDEIYKAQRPRYVFNFVPPGATPGAGEIEFDPSYYDREQLVALIDEGIAGRPEVFLIRNDQEPPYSVHASLGARRAIGGYTVSATGTFVNGYNYHKWIWGHRNPDDNTLQWGRVNELGMGNIILSTDAGRSWYRALLLQVSKPFTDGARWGGDLSYTLAKTEINTYHDVEDNFALDYIPGHELFGFNRVPSRFDERHRVVMNLSTRLPFDVRFSTITTLGSGVPYTLSTGCQGPWDFDDPAGFCAQSDFERPPEFIPGFLANPPGKGPRSERPEGRWFGPFGKWAYRNVDLRLGKDVRLGSQTLGVNLDVINVFNFTNFNHNNFEYNLRWDTGQGAGPFNPLHPRHEYGTFDSRRIQLGARYSF